MEGYRPTSPDGQVQEKSAQQMRFERSVHASERLVTKEEKVVIMDRLWNALMRVQDLRGHLRRLHSATGTSELDRELDSLALEYTAMCLKAADISNLEWSPYMHARIIIGKTGIK